MLKSLLTARVLLVTALFFGGFIPTTPKAQTPVLEGKFTLEAKHSGLALDVPGQSTDNGVQVHQFEPNGTVAQIFTLMPVSGGLHKIVNVGNGKTLEGDPKQLMVEGAKVQQWDFYGGQNQLWVIEESGNGYYSIINYVSNKALSVRDASQESGAVIEQQSYTAAAHQQWKLILLER
jgi:hypothetical protein